MPKLVTALCRLSVRLWQRVSEPRVVSVTHAIVYAALAVVAFYAIITPPATVEGVIGIFSMRLLSVVLAVGAALGVPTALAGVWWLERTAVAFVMLASTIYLGVVLALHFTSGPGTNHLLHAGYVLAVAALHFVRWHRVRQRPYGPDRVPLPSPAASH